VLIEGGTTGLHENDIAAVCARSPRKILCLYTDPAILARDIRRLTGNGRHVVTVLPFDPAPQTALIGTLVILE
jgi:tRNA/tmRNA/rRNA uracil-C5-methylase (TrmA/RlmC/RlmD family)